MENTFYKNVVLPIDLYERVMELELSKIQTNKIFHFIDLLFTHSEREHGSLFAFVSFSDKLFRKIFNSRYPEFLGKLINADIIICDQKASKDSGKPYYYKVNNEIIYDFDKLRSITYKYKHDFVQDLNESKFLEGLERFYNSLNIEFQDLYAAIDEYIFNINANDLKINHGIENKKINVFDESGECKYMYRNTAIRRASKEGKELIEDDGRFYIDTIKGYITKKKNRVRISYEQSVKNLEMGYLYATRNKTNTRLDHNFTNMPKLLMNIIMRQNELCEIDAVNSQYGILANMIKDQIDDDFAIDAIQGNLYEQVMTAIGKNRDKAKKTMMQVVYSKSNTQNKEKSLISEKYPSMMAYVDNFKRKHGYKTLPVLMQKTETKIYVDGLLSILYDMDINAITKHDSVIFKECDREIIQNVLDEVLKDLNYQLKLSS